MSRARPLVAVLVATILLLVGWWAVGALRGGESGSWVRVERDDLVLGVEVTGTLKAVDTSSIGPPQIPWIWEYKISMLAPEGDDVENGQPVLGFDTSELQRRLKEMEKDLEAKKRYYYRFENFNPDHLIDRCEDLLEQAVQFFSGDHWILLGRFASNPGSCPASRWPGRSTSWRRTTPSSGGRSWSWSVSWSQPKGSSTRRPMQSSTAPRA